MSEKFPVMHHSPSFDNVSETELITMNEIKFGDVVVRWNSNSGVVTRAGNPVQLSEKEYNLLKHFLENPGKILSRAELLRNVWGHGNRVPNTRTVDVHVAWLRQKVDSKEYPQFILTIHGQGYKFILPQ